VVSFTPRPFHPQEKNPCYPLDRRLGGPQSRSGHGGEEKNSQPSPGIEPPPLKYSSLRNVTNGHTWEEETTREDLGVDGEIILERILGKYCGKVWTGFTWHRTGTSGGLL
jgi:hypothetical protein